MRLWHKDLIPVLPRQQLLGQWRECCAIAKSISEKGTPNHVLVNRIMDYPIEHFIAYIVLIAAEMELRGHQCDIDKAMKYFEGHCHDLPNRHNIFPGWHNDRYLVQSLMNLQEKFDCHAIPDIEWDDIVRKFGDQYDL